MFQVGPPGTPIQETADSVTAEGTWTGFLEALTSQETLKKALLSLAVVVAVWLLRRLVIRMAEKRLDDVRVRYRWSKTSGYVAFLVSTILVVFIWIEAIRGLGTFLGLLTAGLAIALKDLVANLAGWAFILWRRPFDLGDRIQVGQHAGDVVDIRIFQFTILEIGNWVDADQSTGRIIHVPNAKVFSESMANYTAGFEYLWNEVAVLVTFESDWRKAKEILNEIADEVAAGAGEEAERSMRKASRKLLIFYQKLSPIVYTTVKDSGVMLTLRYLCKPRHRRGTAQAIWEAVLDAFAETPDIDLAYPTQRMYFNALEGKEQARAELPTSWEPRDAEPRHEPPRGSEHHEEQGAKGPAPSGGAGADASG